MFEDQKVQSWTAFRTFGGLVNGWNSWKAMKRMGLEEVDAAWEWWTHKSREKLKADDRRRQTMRNSIVSGDETWSLGIEVFKVMAVISLCVAGLWTAQSKLFLDHIHSSLYRLVRIRWSHSCTSATIGGVSGVESTIGPEKSWPNCRWLDSEMFWLGVGVGWSWPPLVTLKVCKGRPYSYKSDIWQIPQVPEFNMIWHPTCRECVLYVVAT